MTLRYSYLSPDFKRSTVELLSTRMDTFWTLLENRGKLPEVKKEEVIVGKH